MLLSAGCSIKSRISRGSRQAWRPSSLQLQCKLTDALTQLSAMLQDPSIDASAYTAASQAWAQGIGVQEINQLLALSTTASNGLANGLAANAQALLTVAQGLIQSAVTDAQHPADAQAALAACPAAA